MSCGCGESHIVLFQGDSITDCGRSREDLDDLGGGYAMMAAAWYSATYPEHAIRFLNRGISGNRVKDVRARWQEDCLDLGPSLVSILIGINDTWRRYDQNDPVLVEDYEADYRDVLTRTAQALDAQFVLIEPFLLPSGEHLEQYREDLDPKIHVVRKLAREFDAVLVPMDGIFAEAATRRGPLFWSPDGVHPTQPGHALIAQSWLAAVGRAAVL